MIPETMSTTRRTIRPCKGMVTRHERSVRADTDHREWEKKNTSKPKRRDREKKEREEDHS